VGQSRSARRSRCRRSRPGVTLRLFEAALSQRGRGARGARRRAGSGTACRRS
jgi:hypothetical protein